jgi:ankyrin repeat protein
LQNIHPSDYARSAFKANGFEDLAAIESDCDARFLPPTASMMEAYSTEIVQEVRNNNLAAAKTLYEEGRFRHGCNACNRFGESILHIACRRGHLEMVKFLVGEVGLSVTEIRDDYKRTPLHDAFWTSTASPDVVDYLLQQPHVTELLLCKDQRGFTPLDYSRGEDRGKWLRFLWERRDELRPTLDCSEDDEECCSITNPAKRQRIVA